VRPAKASVTRHSRAGALGGRENARDAALRRCRRSPVRRLRPTPVGMTGARESRPFPPLADVGVQYGPGRRKLSALTSATSRRARRRASRILVCGRAHRRHRGTVGRASSAAWRLYGAGCRSRARAPGALGQLEERRAAAPTGCLKLPARLEHVPAHRAGRRSAPGGRLAVRARHRDDRDREPARWYAASSPAHASCHRRGTSGTLRRVVMERVHDQAGAPRRGRVGQERVTVQAIAADREAELADAERPRIDGTHP